MYQINVTKTVSGKKKHSNFTVQSIAAVNKTFTQAKAVYQAWPLCEESSNGLKNEYSLTLKDDSGNAYELKAIALKVINPNNKDELTAALAV